MIKTKHLFSFSLHRQRVFLVKVVVLFSSVTGLIFLLSPSELELDPSAIIGGLFSLRSKNRNQKTEGGLTRIGAVSDTWNNKEEEKERRRIAEKENMDEFLVSVLEEYKYSEVDLREKHSSSSYDYYDHEIEDDLDRVIPGLGEKGDMKGDKAANFQSLFRKGLSDMISPNRRVPDNREAA